MKKDLDKIEQCLLAMKETLEKSQELVKADPVPPPSIGTQGVGAGTVNTSAATAIMQSGGFFHKDELDEKIKAKMREHMDQRGIGGKQIADHYRDIDETIPAKQRSNIKAGIGKQNAPKPKLNVVKEEDFTVEQPEVHKQEGGSGGGAPASPSTTVVGSMVAIRDKKKKDPKIKPFPHNVFQQSERVNIAKNGQWSMEKSGYGPKGMGLYNPADNANRKAKNTGDTVADAGKNVNVKSYTTSGSSMAQAAEAAETKRQAAANKAAPVKTLANMSDEEKAKLEAQYGAKIKKEE